MLRKLPTREPIFLRGGGGGGSLAAGCSAQEPLLNWLENKKISWKGGWCQLKQLPSIIQTLLMQAFQALDKGKVGEGSFLTSSYKLARIINF